MKFFSSRISFKFNLVIALVVTLLMSGGAAIVISRISATLDHDLNILGDNLASVLANASVDPLLLRDVMKLDELVENLKTTEVLLYAFVEGKDGKPLTSVKGSFNDKEPIVKSLLPQVSAKPIYEIAGELKSRLPVIEVIKVLSMDGKPLGRVIVGLYSRENQQTVRRTIYTMVAVSLGLVIILVLTISMMFRFIISRPLEKVVKLASSVAVGDLTQSVRVFSQDEVGRLAESMNAMGANLSGMIRGIQAAAIEGARMAHDVRTGSASISEGSILQAGSAKEASSSVTEMDSTLKSVAESSQDLQISNEQVSATILQMMSSLGVLAQQAQDLSGRVNDTSVSITELSAAINNIAQSTSVLNESADQVVSTASEMKVSIKQVDQLARQSSSMAQEAAREAKEKGLVAVETIRAGITDIDKTVSRSSAIIDSLGRKVNDAGAILNVIKEVAGSTSLLALNASILAAQAGEHGRGFSVVAGEIRELAERTAASTKDITTLIKSVQQEALSAVEAINLCTESVKEGMAMARDSERTFTTIIEKTIASGDMGRKIAQVTTEQARGMEHMAVSVERLSEMTQQILRATQEQRVGSELILKTMEQMTDVTAQVKSVTEEHSQSGKHIIGEVESVRDKVRRINEATQEQHQRSREIVKAIEQVVHVIERNQGMSDTLTRTAETLQNQSERLKNDVSRFSL